MWWGWGWGGSHITAPLERQFTIKSAGQQKFYWFKTWIIYYTKKLSYISRSIVNQLIRKKRQKNKNLWDCPFRQHLMLLLFVAAKENTPSSKKWWPRQKLVPYYHYMDLCVHQPMEAGWGGMLWRDQRLFKLIQTTTLMLSSDKSLLPNVINTQKVYRLEIINFLRMSCWYFRPSFVICASPDAPFSFSLVQHSPAPPVV